MTPEEQAVLDAAERWSRTQTVEQAEDASEALQDAIGRLKVSRQPQFQWYARTWVDVRPGDRIRMSGVEARVLSVTPLEWHVHPATGTGPGNPPVAHEHTLISYRLAAPYDRQLYQIQPTAPVEIQVDQREIAAWQSSPVTMLWDFWSDRLSVQDS